MKLLLARAPMILFLVFAGTQALGQAPASPSPVPYSSVSELNLLLSDLDQTSRDTQQDLTRLRIEKWKTDSNTKRSSQADVDSIQRNLQNALPEIVGQLRNAPDSLNATFKLYRNIDAVYDVFTSLTEATGAFGSKDEFQSLQNALSGLERSRKAFADRMESLAGAKDSELSSLRAKLQAKEAAASVPAAPKKVVVDDEEAPKKPVKKRVPAKVPKPAAAPKSGETAPPQNPQP